MVFVLLSNLAPWIVLARWASWWSGAVIFLRGPYIIPVEGH